MLDETRKEIENYNDEISESIEMYKEIEEFEKRIFDEIGESIRRYNDLDINL